MQERHLTTGEVAKIYFGHRANWLRDVLADMAPWDVPKNQGGQRWYTLGDVEKIAVWLVERQRINGIDAERVLEMVKLTRKGWEG